MGMSQIGKMYRKEMRLTVLLLSQGRWSEWRIRAYHTVAELRP